MSNHIPTSSVSPTLHAPRFTLHAARKYFNIFRAALIERLAYRGDFILATFLRFLPMVTTIVLWHAIYAGARDSSLGSAKIQFTYSQMISYLLLVHISRMFSSMPGLAGGISRETTLYKYASRSTMLTISPPACWKAPR